MVIVVKTTQSNGIITIFIAMTCMQVEKERDSYGKISKGKGNIHNISNHVYKITFFDNISILCKNSKFISKTFLLYIKWLTFNVRGELSLCKIIKMTRSVTEN